MTVSALDRDSKKPSGGKKMLSDSFIKKIEQANNKKEVLKRGKFSYWIDFVYTGSSFKRHVIRRNDEKIELNILQEA